MSGLSIGPSWSIPLKQEREWDEWLAKKKTEAQEYVKRTAGRRKGGWKGIYGVAHGIQWCIFMYFLGFTLLTNMFV